MSHELHPLCTLFPRVSGAEFDALVADIKANGLMQPIVLHDGMILDGGNRYRACLEAGVEPAFAEFAGENIVSFVLSVNLHRRHLSPGQQAAIVASAQDWAKAQSAGKPKSGNVAGLDRVEDRAAQSGASERTQRMADKVAKADPELAKQVAHGEISLPKAVEKIDPKPAKRQMSKQLDRPADIPALTDADREQDVASAIDSLTAEVEHLRDRLAVEAMDASEEEKTLASETISELRAKVKTLTAELDAVKASRDSYMREAAEAKKQAVYWRKQAEKVSV